MQGYMIAVGHYEVPGGEFLIVVDESLRMSLGLDSQTQRFPSKGDADRWAATNLYGPERVLFYPSDESS